MWVRIAICVLLFIVFVFLEVEGWKRDKEIRRILERNHHLEDLQKMMVARVRRREEDMDRAKLNYHKNNIEEAEWRVERFLAHKNEDKSRLEAYGIMKACTTAIGFILDEMERKKK